VIKNFLAFGILKSITPRDKLRFLDPPAFLQSRHVDNFTSINNDNTLDELYLF